MRCYHRPTGAGVRKVIGAGQVVEDYLMLGILGRGGFGEVWEARHVRTQERFAIKFLHVDYIEQDDGLSLPERFRAEARVLTELDHPGLVRIFGIIDRREERVLAYVMELLRGNPLDVIKNEIDIGALVHVFRRVAASLVYLHERGIIHRDVKSGNIFVCDPEPDETGRPIKLLDFGISKLPDTQIQTKTGILLGTLNTMPPECFEVLFGPAEPLTPAVDQWSFAVALYRMLTGRMPFRGGSLPELVRAIRSFELPAYPLLDKFEGDPHAARLREILEPCFEKRPTERYQDMEVVMTLLEEVEDDLTSVRARGGQPAPTHSLDQLAAVGDRPTLMPDDTLEDEVNSSRTDLLDTPLQEARRLIRPHLISTTGRSSVTPEDQALSVPPLVTSAPTAMEPMASSSGTVTLDSAETLSGLPSAPPPESTGGEPQVSSPTLDVLSEPDFVPGWPVAESVDGMTALDSGPEDPFASQEDDVFAHIPRLRSDTPSEDYGPTRLTARPVADDDPEDTVDAPAGDIVNPPVVSISSVPRAPSPWTFLWLGVVAISTAVLVVLTLVTLME